MLKKLFICLCVFLPFEASSAVFHLRISFKGLPLINSRMYFEFPDKAAQFGERQVRGITDRNGEVFFEFTAPFPLKLTKISGDCGFPEPKGGMNTDWLVEAVSFDKTGYLHLELADHYKNPNQADIFLVGLNQIDTSNSKYRELQKRYANRNPLLDHLNDQLFYANYPKQQKLDYIRDMKADLKEIDERLRLNRQKYDSLKTDFYNLRTSYCRKSIELDELWKQQRESTIASMEELMKPKPKGELLFISDSPDFSKELADKKLELDNLHEMIVQEDLDKEFSEKKKSPPKN
ncbi:hypothetical protein [Fluviicola taffensis]|uniref:hypothetical protein n=1 Tax=Fluviicola taffensis TaxID=191579 RepID=UPI003137CEB9